MKNTHAADIAPLKIELLQWRFQYYKNYSGDTLHIFAENANAGSNNLERLQFAKINLYSIAATDKIPKIISADKTKEVLSWFQTETGELKGVFDVKLNARTMLTVKCWVLR